jgi:hypothetical protein
MSERRVAMAGVALVTVCLAVAAVLLARSWETKPRSFLASVPQPSPLTSTPVIPVRPERTLCIAPATILPTSQVALIRIGTRGKPSVDVSAWVEAPGGYRSEDAIKASEWADNDLLTFVLDPPARDVEGRFCVRNDGRRVMDVYAADDRTKSLAVTRVDGRRQNANVQLAFAERAPGTVAGHRGRIVEKVTAFRPAVVGTPVVWALAGLVLIALTVLPGLALLAALRRRDDDEVSAAAAGAPTRVEHRPADPPVPSAPPRDRSPGTE